MPRKTPPPSVHRTVSRRRFLQQSAALGAAATLGAPAIVRGRNLNDKLNIAVIGCGGRGGGNLKRVSTENIVVLWELNQAAIDRAAEMVKAPRHFTDFRKVYDHANTFDAVVVSTC